MARNFADIKILCCGVNLVRAMCEKPAKIQKKIHSALAFAIEN